mgnify:CR=1 FL=1
MDFNEFFKQHKDCLIYGHEDMVNFTTEELYHAIKARLMAEIEVFCGRLTDKYD